jgi:signal transduction histidine kinase
MRVKERGATPFEPSVVDRPVERVPALIPSALWIVDCDLRITTAYGPGFDSLGLHPELETIVGLDLFEYFGTDDPGFESIASHVRALDGESVICESKLRGRVAEVRLEPLRAEGEIVGVIGFALDVTDHRVLREQLVHAEQAESFGALAAGIAHDFNNVLTTISGFANLALAEVEPGSAAAAHLQQVTEAADRGSAMTRRLLTFSHHDAPEARQVDANEAVVGLETMLRQLLGARIRLVTDLDGPLPKIATDPNQLRRLLVNCAVNARDAMPDGGVLTIQTRHAADERNVVLNIRDTGTGMSAEVRARLFEPFFTTKPDGQGTGLGLSAVQGIVTQSGGWIEVDTEPGRGTTFSIGLPAAAAA